MYQQLTSLGGIFERSTFFTQYSEHISMAASDNLYYFCNFSPLLTSINTKKRICKQFSLKFLVRIFSQWKVFRGFLWICCPIIKKRKNQLKYFQAPQPSCLNYVSLVFLTWTRRRTLVQKPIVSQNKCLQSAIA